MLHVESTIKNQPIPLVKHFKVAARIQRKSQTPHHKDLRFFPNRSKELHLYLLGKKTKNALIMRIRNRELKKIEKLSVEVLLFYSSKRDMFYGIYLFTI